MSRRLRNVSYLRGGLLLVLIATLAAPWFRIWGSCDTEAGRYCGYTYVAGASLWWGDVVLILALATLALTVLHLRRASTARATWMDFVLTWGTLVWIVGSGLWNLSTTVTGNGIGHTWWGAALGLLAALAQVVALGYQVVERERHEQESLSDETVDLWGTPVRPGQ